jgi:hypothetical protein
MKMCAIPKAGRGSWRPFPYSASRVTVLTVPALALWCLCRSGLPRSGVARLLAVLSRQILGYLGLQLRRLVSRPFARSIQAASVGSPSRPFPRPTRTQLTDGISPTAATSRAVALRPLRTRVRSPGCSEFLGGPRARSLSSPLRHRRRAVAIRAWAWVPRRSAGRLCALSGTPGGWR